MRKSKYIGLVINNMEVLNSKSYIKEGTYRNFFIVRCLKCNKIIEKDRSSFIRKEVNCLCSYKQNLRKQNYNKRLYNIWTNMKGRCYNSNHPRYKIYGERGITICEQWKNDFNKFEDWALKNGYNDNLSIDRIDVNGNYEPKNCKWSTQLEQCNNTRRTHFITYKNKTQSIRYWSKELNINFNTLRGKIYKGLTLEEIMGDVK